MHTVGRGAISNGIQRSTVWIWRRRATSADRGLEAVGYEVPDLRRFGHCPN
jgi:hypothetical protein